MKQGPLPMKKSLWHSSHGGFRSMLVVGIFMIGCSEPPRGGPRIKTTPVIGIVSVDGEKAEGIEVGCIPDGASELKRPLSTFTDKDGKFTLGTYQSGDGLPQGNYTLIFKWEVPGPGVPINKLDKRYNDPKLSKNTVIVKDGEKNEIGEIKLSKKFPG
jgi:hypothetical protein